MILTNNKKLFNKLIKIRQYGWDNKRNANITGINSRLDEIQAAILSTKLKNIYTDNKKEIISLINILRKLKTRKLLFHQFEKTLFMHFIYLQF